jgi:hydrogenase maturation protease
MYFPHKHGSDKVVLGIGNILNTDEGIGVHAIRALQEKYQDPQGFAIEDGGTLGLNLLPMVDDASHLLIVDAVDAGKSAGTIIRLQGEDIPLFGGAKLSEHQITFQEVLGLAMLRNTLPENLYLIGIQPADMSIGIGLSETTKTKMPEVLSAIEDVLREWGTAL